MAIYKVKHECTVCHNGITVYRHCGKYNYYKCDKCNLIFVLDRQTDKYVRAYEPRKTIKL